MKNVMIGLCLVFLLLGCTANQEVTNQQNMTNEKPQMEGKTAQANDTVKVDYVGTLEDGTLFDTSLEEVARQNGFPPRPSYQPIQFIVGAGQMIPGFDAAVVGMKEGEEKTVQIPPEEAYGQMREDFVFTVPISQIEGGENLEVGGQIQANTGAVGTITALDGENATIDFNHALAGKALTFRIIMRTITKSG